MKKKKKNINMLPHSQGFFLKKHVLNINLKKKKNFFGKIGIVTVTQHHSRCYSTSCEILGY